MLKKEILMGFSPLLLLTLTLLLSCGGPKEISENEEEIFTATDDNKGVVMIKEPMDLTFEFLDMLPHCGGAAPREGVNYPIKSPIRGGDWEVFKVMKDGNRGQLIGHLLSNDEGKASYRLQPGHYQLWWKSKTMKFEDFMKTESPDLGNMKAYKDEACFREWYKTPDYDFNVVEDSNYVVAYKNRCFVGRNPCMIYTGPPPP